MQLHRLGTPDAVSQDAVMSACVQGEHWGEAEIEQGEHRGAALGLVQEVMHR